MKSLKMSKGLSEALFQGTDNTNACSDCLFFNWSLIRQCEYFEWLLVVNVIKYYTFIVGWVDQYKELTWNYQ